MTWSNGPLMRAKLVKLGAEEHIVLLTLHHIVADAWSVGILIREFAALYEGFRNGKEISLPQLPIQYVDYAVWQREHLKGDAQERQLRYWREQLLTPLPPVLDLPADKTRPRIQTFKGSKHIFGLPPEMAARVLELSRETDTTVFMVLAGRIHAAAREVHW